MKIESLQNPKIKLVQKLYAKARERKKLGLFVVEGAQENQFCLAAENEPDFILVSDESSKPFDFLTNQLTIACDSEIFSKITYRNTSKIIGVYHQKNISLNDFLPSENAKLVVLESIEKPGNLGAILRSCEALGAEAVLVANPLLDVFNPNVIRSSVGTVFQLPIITESNENIYNYLKNNKLKIYSTHMHENSQGFETVDYNKGVALVFGTESTGLTSFWAEKSDANILIPMQGKVNSLNLSNAVAIVLSKALGL